MKTKILSRAYLETLSTPDLISLADEYGIDIPDDLNRRFIVGELLEAAEELDRPEQDKMLTDEEHAPVHTDEEELPKTYNETVISAMLRNPAWAFVFWDIRADDLTRLNASGDFSHLSLRVSIFDQIDSSLPAESFEVQVSMDGRSQYVLLPFGKKFFRVDLIAHFSGKKEDLLAISRRISIPHGNELLTEALPGRELDISPALRLSGLSELLKNHYENHRQSFS